LLITSILQYLLIQRRSCFLGFGGQGVSPLGEICENCGTKI